MPARQNSGPSNVRGPRRRVRILLQTPRAPVRITDVSWCRSVGRGGHIDLRIKPPGAAWRMTFGTGRGRGVARRRVSRSCRSRVLASNARTMAYAIGGWRATSDSAISSRVPLRFSKVLQTRQARVRAERLLVQERPPSRRLQPRASGRFPFASLRWPARSNCSVLTVEPPGTESAWLVAPQASEDAQDDVADAPNTATQTQRGVSDRRAQGIGLLSVCGFAHPFSPMPGFLCGHSPETS
jgi:hypothetical protein